MFACEPLAASPKGTPSMLRTSIRRLFTSLAVVASLAAVNAHAAVVPLLSVNDVTSSEGNSGVTDFIFTVSLSGGVAGAQGVSFDFFTAGGTATSDIDFLSLASSRYTIFAGESQWQFSVGILGDTLFEADETFFVNITNVIGAFVTDGQGLGTILNDDARAQPPRNDVPEPASMALAAIALVAAGMSRRRLVR
jgi:hypothetical protein